MFCHLLFLAGKHNFMILYLLVFWPLKLSTDQILLKDQSDLRMFHQLYSDFKGVKCVLRAGNDPVSSAALFLGWVGLLVQIMEGGSPGNPVGVHQSGIWGWSQGIDPGVWSGSGGGEMRADSIGVWRRGGSRGEEREEKTGKWEQEALVRAVGGVECFTRSLLCPVASGRGRLLLVLLLRQPLSNTELMCDTVILTHILHSVTPHRLGTARSSSYILWVGQQRVFTEPTLCGCTGERESHTVAVFAPTPQKGRGRGKGEERGERSSRGEGASQGRDDGGAPHRWFLHRSHSAGRRFTTAHSLILEVRITFILLSWHKYYSGSLVNQTDSDWCIYGNLFSFVNNQQWKSSFTSSVQFSATCTSVITKI